MVEKSHTAGLWPGLYEPFKNFGARLTDWLAPPSDAKASETAYSISVELPGVSEEDIELRIEDGVVMLKGEKRSEREEKGDTWFFAERQYGAFQRSFRLPEDADAAGVRADLQDGVLTLTVPKKAPEQKSSGTAIPINTR